jgi:hypothetical protein
MPNTTARVIAHFREVDTQSYYPIFNSGKRNLLKQFKAPLRRGNGPREAPKVHFFEKAKAAAVALRDAERAATLVNIRHWPAKSLLESMIGAQKGQYTLAELRPVRLCRSGYTNLAGGNCIDKQ